MLKQRGWHRKQNPLSTGVVFLTWSYIYWTHTLTSSIWSLDRELCHVVGCTIIKKDFSKTLENEFFHWCQIVIENQSDT